MIVAGIEYKLPEVTLLQETGIGTSEIAARTCYDSFELSENDCIKDFDTLNKMGGTNTSLINNIEHSNLLDDLAWTYFHHSILEHANLTYLIKGTSRGVLQEHSRHRIQAISVRSTRYTMQKILHAFNASVKAITETQAKSYFFEQITIMDMFVVSGDAARIEIHQMYDKLNYQRMAIGDDEFLKLTMSKEALSVYNKKDEYEDNIDLFNALISCKSKRNVGDPFKWVVTDNWKVDMVVTMNLRALKNYFDLRDSGAAYFQIRNLAKAMKEATPKKYLDLIIKNK